MYADIRGSGIEWNKVQCGGGTVQYGGETVDYGGVASSSGWRH